ncbi:hypothetical protein NVP1253O_21 [Vibrio phage 1.253.O._10N.286.45.B12]|nr:hypothetical protein NVP1235O_21 [Vibrio phage 1.235.O._10N.261.52.B2]AUR98545.1 hypothetical protein NVP1253O_21 [Vibrio phage 1.253.O._10N.286.45.B12]
MARLEQFQNNSVDQANLQQIPTEQKAPSPLATFASAAQGLAPAVGSAFVEGAKLNAKDKKAGSLDTFSKTLQNISQTSKTTPGFDYESAVRKATQEALAKGDGFGQEYLKIVNRDTGIDPAGEAQAAIDERARIKEVEDAGVINSNMSEEEREFGIKRYYENKGENKTLQMKLEKVQTQKALGELGDEQAKNAVYGNLSNVVNNQYDIITNQANSWARRYENGESAKVIMQEIRVAKLKWGQTVSLYGGLATDTTGKAMIQPISDMFTNIEGTVTGEFDRQAWDNSVKTKNSQATAILYEDPSFVADVATSKAFEHSPTVKLEIAARVAKARNRLSETLNGLSSQDANDMNKTIKSMSTSDDPATVQESNEAVAGIIEKLDRNGSVMSLEDKKNAMVILDDDAMWANATPAQRQMAVDAFQMHMADEIKPSLVAVTDQGGIAQYATLTTDGNGLRMQINDGFQGQRQVQLAVRKANKELAEWNASLRWIMRAENLSMDEAASKYFGVGVEDELAGPAEAELGQSIFDPNLNNPTSIEDRDAQALAIGDRIRELIGMPPREEATPLPQGSTTSTTPTTEVPEPTVREAKPDLAVNSDEFKNGFIQAAVEEGSTQEEAEELWELISAPATDDVDMGQRGRVSFERAKNILSTPAR